MGGGSKLVTDVLIAARCVRISCLQLRPCSLFHTRVSARVAARCDTVRAIRETSGLPPVGTALAEGGSSSPGGRQPRRPPRAARPLLKASPQGDGRCQRCLHIPAHTSLPAHLCLHIPARTSLPTHLCLHGASFTSLPAHPCPHIPACTSLPARPCLQIPARTSLPAWPCPHIPARTRAATVERADFGNFMELPKKTELLENFDLPNKN